MNASSTSTCKPTIWTANEVATATFDSQSAGRNVLKLNDVRGNGPSQEGRVDWAALEEAFGADKVTLENGVVPGLLRQGTYTGCTMKLFRNGQRVAVKVYKQGLKHGREEAEDSPEKRRKLGKVQLHKTGLIDFWKNLPSVREQGAFLQLTNGTFFLGHPMYQDKLYVRQEYKDLSSLIDNLHKTNACIAVVGTPGIGKSMFGYWLMHKWALEGRSIVLRKRNFWGGSWILFCKAGIFDIREEDLLEELLEDPETRYLVDGIEPLQYPNGAKMVFLTLPDPSVYHEFLKPAGYTWRYMDIWSAEEIEVVREAMYPEVAPDKCQSRLDRWGPIPRYVLEKTDAVDQAELERAIAICKLATLESAVGKCFTANDVSHNVVHLKVPPDSQHVRAVAVFASDYVAEAAFNKLLWRDSAGARAWAAAGMNSSEPGVLRSHLYELSCHQTLCSGGKFDVRRLADSSKTARLSLPHSTLMKVDDWSEAGQASSKTYCQAKKRNTAAIDAVQQPGRMFQIIVSKTHSTNCAGLRAAVDCMEAKQAAKLYFVVPPDQYADFKPKPIAQGTGVANLREIEQWVLKMPY